MKYRKKPVIIEAEQYTGEGTDAKGVCRCKFAIDRPHVHTIHANQVVVLEIGDFVIPEPDGEHFYPCKPDIFANTYEPIA